MKTRFVWGLIADIHSPDYETRIAIIKAKALLFAVSLPEDVVYYIADTIKLNIRQLEGAVKKMLAMHELMGVNLDLELAKLAIKDIFRESPGTNPTAEIIVNEVSKFYNVSADKIVGMSRAKEIVVPRQIAMYIVRELTTLSLNEIGREFNKDHSTVFHSLDKIDTSLKKDTELKNYDRRSYKKHKRIISYKQNSFNKFLISVFICGYLFYLYYFTFFCQFIKIPLFM